MDSALRREVPARLTGAVTANLKPYADLYTTHYAAVDSCGHRIRRNAKLMGEECGE